MTSPERKKELKQHYKDTKPDMGIFMIYCPTGNKCYLQSAKNLPGAINRARFQLNGGLHPNRELQKEWTELGADKFQFTILELLETKEEEINTDFSEELALLETIWENKLAEDNKQFYRK